MEFVSKLFRTDPTPPVEVSSAKTSEEFTIGAICNFFTENMNYLITASLIYFALFAGFARMRSKHLMIAVPAAAIWTVIQAKAWIGTLAVGTTLLGLAQAFFAWQSAGGAAQQAQGLGEMAARFTEGAGGVRNAASVVADQVLHQPPVEMPKHVASSPFQRVTDSVMDQIGSRHSAPSTPLSGERTTSLFGNVDEAIEEFNAFSAQRSPHEVGISPSSGGRQLLEMGEELDLDRLADEMEVFSPSSRDLDLSSQRFSPSDTLGQLQEALPDPSRVSPSHSPKLERIWSEVSSQSLSPETNRMFESMWQQGLEQAPKDVNAQDWAAEFLVREGKKKGMSFGQIAKWCVGLAIAGLTIWGLYKLWCATSEEIDQEEEVREADLEKDHHDLDELETESGWLSSLGNALSYLVPESDGYGSDTDGMHMLSGGLMTFDSDRYY